MKRFFPAYALDASRPRTLAAPPPCDSKAGMLSRRLLLALVLAAAVAAGNFFVAGDVLAWRVGAPFALALVVALPSGRPRRPLGSRPRRLRRPPSRRGPRRSVSSASSRRRAASSTS